MSREFQKDNQENNFEAKCQDFLPKKSWDWVIYGIEHCPYCVKAKELLKNQKIKYLYFDVQKAPFNGKEEYKKLMKDHLQEHKTFPAVFHKGKLLGGYSDLYNYFDEEF